jgi:hypothetical protein
MTEDSSVKQKTQMQRESCTCDTRNAPGVAAAAVVSNRQREEVEHDVWIGAIIAAANEAAGFKVIRSTGPRA